MLRTQSVAKYFLLLSLTGLCIPVRADKPSAPADDVVARIKDEGLNRSEVMQTLSYLSDVIGPRLTASPSMMRANEWTRSKLTEWGLSNAHLEAWGPFGRGWELERFSAQVISPLDIPLIAYPKAWSPGLKGNYTGEVVFVDAKTEADLEKYRGKLKGAIVLNSPVRVVKAHFESLGSRYTDERLAEMEAGTPRQRQPRLASNAPAVTDVRARAALAGAKARFFMEEGVALLVDSSPRGDGGTVFVQSAAVPQPVPAARPTNAPQTGGSQPAAGSATPAGTASPVTTSPAGTATAPAESTPIAANPTGGPAVRTARTTARRISPWDKNAPKIIPQIVVATEQYNRIMRMLDAGEKVKMAVELNVKFYDNDLMAHNTIAEIPGGDLKDQIVMLGAHMDSWHAGTGATDNGAGCAVALEAVRILEKLHLQPRRTIRIGLWSGEEEGLLGSRAYVTEHFASRFIPLPGAERGPVEMIHKPDFEKLSGYFNLDNGTGKIRGIYLQGNEAVGPIFRDWLTPFKDMGASTITISNTGSTDHVSFDSVGIPGFQFIQDEIEYDTRTHHSNEDVFDRIQEDDLKQAAVIMATFVYNTAMRDELLPRKPEAKSTVTSAATP